MKFLFVICFTLFLSTVSFAKAQWTGMLDSRELGRFQVTLDLLVPASNLVELKTEKYLGINDQTPEWICESSARTQNVVKWNLLLENVHGKILGSQFSESQLSAGLSVVIDEEEDCSLQLSNGLIHFFMKSPYLKVKVGHQTYLTISLFSGFMSGDGWLNVENKTVSIDAQSFMQHGRQVREYDVYFYVTREWDNSTSFLEHGQMNFE